jgi:type II secretory pathway pseudopilin PulG
MPDADIQRDMVFALARLIEDRWRRLRRGRDDDGMTIVEMLVAMTLVTVAVLGLLGELAADIKQQHTEKTQSAAVRLATSELESAKSTSFASLLSLVGTTTDTPTVQGTTYTRVTTLQLCSATDAPGTCTTPAGTTPSTARATVAVSWTNNGSTHTVRMSRNLADTSSKTLSTALNPLGSCGGGGTTLVTGTLALSPSSVTVNSSGNPSSAVTATLTQTGLSNATCVPLTWSDDTGSHQLSMTGSGGTYSVSIPASSITKVVSSSGGSVSFTATVPGSQAVPSKSLTIVGPPTFASNCTVSVAGLGLNIIKLAVLSRNSLLAATVTCTTTGLSSTDTVKATYASGSSGNTKTLSLTSSNGNTWTGTIPAGTAMASSGTSEAFSFSLKRISDDATASSSLTVTLI